MADPHIHSPMDSLDYVAVIFYRTGLSLAAPVVALLPWHVPYFPAFQLLCLSAVLCASSLHIYAKSFRMLLQMATWVGLLLIVAGYPLFGMGGLFITLGGLCYKEYYCFRIPGLRLQPFLLAALWFSLVVNQQTVATIIAVITALLFLVVSVAKWRMPLHFDIGDKTKYEV